MQDIDFICRCMCNLPGEQIQTRWLVFSFPAVIEDAMKHVFMIPSFVNIIFSNEQRLICEIRSLDL